MTPPAAPAREGWGTGSTSVAVLLAAAALLAAVIGGRASLLSDRGSDTWHQSIRQHVKSSAGIVETVRFLYEEEAATALHVAEARILADELRAEAQRASGGARALLGTEAAAQEHLAETLESSAFASDPRYALEGDGFDVGRRLLDLRAEDPDLVALDPDAVEREGRELGEKASILVATTVPVGVAFLLGALAQAVPRRRRDLVAAGFVVAGIGGVLAIVVELAL